MTDTPEQIKELVDASRDQPANTSVVMTLGELRALLDAQPVPTDNAALVEAVREIKAAWDWWQVDNYDRCASVVADAIDDALALASREAAPAAEPVAWRIDNLILGACSYTEDQELAEAEAALIWMGKPARAAIPLYASPQPAPVTQEAGELVDYWRKQAVNASRQDAPLASDRMTETADMIEAQAARIADLEETLTHLRGAYDCADVVDATLSTTPEAET